MGARAPHTSTDNENKPTFSRASRRQCRANSTKKTSPLDRGSRLTVRGVGGTSPPGAVVWRTRPNSQHGSQSLAEVIKDLSGCAIEGRYISIPPHEGVGLAEGGLRGVHHTMPTAENLRGLPSKQLHTNVEPHNSPRSRAGPGPSP